MRKRIVWTWIWVLAVIAVIAMSGCFGKPDSNSTEQGTNSPKSTAEEGGEDKSGGEDGAVSKEDADGSATPEDALPMTFQQAPELEGQELPAVQERLPSEPKLINQIPLEHLEGGQLEIGEYGGTLRMVNPSPDWNPDIFLMLNEPLLNTPGSTGEVITPNILKDFQMSPDSKQFTFLLREGLKWSDGVPVTTADVQFAVEDVLLDPDLTPGFPNWLKSGGKRDGAPMSFEIIDEFSFKISFDEPYGRFPVQLALTGWRGYTDLLKPRHYLEQYHVKYRPLEELEPQIKEAGFEKGEWTNLFHLKDITNWELTTKNAIGFPVLYPWMLAKATTSVYEYARNPYFWKIDTAGNQLPYIDKIVSTHVQDVEMMSTKVIAGEVDLMRESAALNKMPLYKEYEEKGGFKAPMLDMHVDPTSIFLNLTYEDDNWRKVVRDVRFRQALNMAMDRAEIIDAVYFGFADLPELVPSDYDPEEANRLLDEMGLDKKDKDGYRIGPNGKTFEIPFETGAHAPDMIPVLQLVVDMWNKVGVKTTMKTIDSSLWGTRRDANQLLATVMWNVQPMWRSGGWTDFMPNLEGPLWNLWYAKDGQAGEAPPEEVQRLYQLNGEMMGVYPSTPEDQKVVGEIYQIHHDYLLQMPIAERVQQPLILNAKIGNVPIGGTAVAANIGGVQFYYKEE